MGFQIQNSRQQRTSLSEINVTPLVDVMLVLLIVFMISAPLMQQGVPIQLPKAKGDSLDQKSDPTRLTMDSAGKIYLGETTLELSHIQEKLSLLRISTDQPLLLQADERVPYGSVMGLLSTLKAGGYTKIGLVTEAPSRNPSSIKKKNAR